MHPLASPELRLCSADEAVPDQDFPARPLAPGQRLGADIATEAAATAASARAMAGPARAFDAAARREFVRQLEDLDYGMPAYASQPCIEALGSLLSSLPFWPPGLRLAWGQLPARPQAQAQVGDARDVLVVSMHERTGRTKLVVDWLQGMAAGSAVIPAHSRYRRELDIGLHDAFDAIATGLDMATAHAGGRCMTDPDHPAHPAHSRHGTGLGLRLALGAWLRSGGAPDWQVPDLAWTHRGSTADPAAPALPRPAQLAVQHRRQPPTLSPLDPPAVAIPAAIEPASTALSVKGPERPGADMSSVVLSLATELRQGGWNTLLERIVLQVVTRLPPAHPAHVSVVDLEDDQGLISYCVRPRGGRRRTLRRTGSQAPWVYTRSGNTLDTSPWRTEGPDALLEMLLPRTSVRGQYPAAQVRACLADVMQANPTLVRLCAALYERFPNHLHHDVLLRLCLRGGQLTDAGRQLLDPSIPQREPTVEDLIRWCSDAYQHHGRRLQNFIDDGVDILKAHHLFSPVGPTPAGKQLLSEHADGYPVYANASSRVRHMESELASLLYAYQSMKSISAYLGYSEPTVFRHYTPLCDSARAQSEVWQRADELFVPSIGPGSVPARRLRGRPVGSHPQAAQALGQALPAAAIPHETVVARLPLWPSGTASPPGSAPVDRSSARSSPGLVAPFPAAGMDWT